ncbi:MAG: hypothetical protein QOF94_437 [Acidobacteriaceae bacterium]|jgi:hypothetical protein
MPADAPRFAQETRLKYLDTLLFWEGRANRSDLIEKFQISPAQAALDLKSYLAAANARSVRYDTRAKRYEATQQFKPVFGLPSPEEWLARAHRPDADQIDVLPTLGRHTDVHMLARTYRAIRDKKALQIDYQSMTDAEPKVRWIAPHALASDGLRWHARAYCFLHEDYRDFVLTRMAGGGAKGFPQRAADELPPDREWSNIVELDLIPATSLGVTQAAAIRREYGFKSDVLIVRVRQALLFYAIRRWGLDLPDSRLLISSQRVIEKEAKEIAEGYSNGRR